VNGTGKPRCYEIRSSGYGTNDGLAAEISRNENFSFNGRMVDVGYGCGNPNINHD
jgi:hypothetical protein